MGVGCDSVGPGCRRLSWSGMVRHGTHAASRVQRRTLQVAPHYYLNNTQPLVPIQGQLPPHCNQTVTMDCVGWLALTRTGATRTKPCPREHSCNRSPGALRRRLCVLVLRITYFRRCACVRCAAASPRCCSLCCFTLLLPLLAASPCCFPSQDHVPPPVAPSPDGKNSTNPPFDFQRLGIRVPAVCARASVCACVRVCECACALLWSGCALCMCPVGMCVIIHFFPCTCIRTGYG